MDCLVMTMYLYTGRVVPRSQRWRLCSVLGQMLRGELSALPHQLEGEQSHLMRAFGALAFLISGDSAFDAFRAEIATVLSFLHMVEVTLLASVGHTIARYMPLWPWQWQQPQHRNDGFALLPSTAVVSAYATLRGAGLVASA
jgi:hypothetical protein